MVFRLVVELAVLALALGLAAIVIGSSGEGSGLVKTVNDAMPDSGVKHPVTAVLLNFRGYDTLLEMLVLLLALVGVRSLGDLPSVPQAQSASPVLRELLRFLTPLLLLVAAYLLWRGSSGPGGAFQAGAVLGAAGVLWLLAEKPESQVPSLFFLRPILVLGVGVFAAAGMALALSGGPFLAYPDASAGTWIFAIEAFASVSIAVTLLVLFVGTPIDGD